MPPSSDEGGSALGASAGAGADTRATSDEEGRTEHEEGIIWKQAVLVSSVRLGEASRSFIHNHVGNLVEGMDLDVSSLPVGRARPWRAGSSKPRRAVSHPSTSFETFFAA